MKRFFSLSGVFLALVILGVLPFIVFGALVGWTGMQKVAVYGFFVCLYATVLNGRRLGMAMAVGFAIFAVIGTQVHASPLGGAMVVGMSAVLIVCLATRGYAQAMLFAAMFIPYPIATPPQPWAGASMTSLTYLAAVLGATFIAGLWGLVLGGLIHDKLPAAAPVPGASRQDALIAGVLLVPVAAAITYLAMSAFPQAKWVWLLATIYSLIKPSPDLNWVMTRDMVVGTVVGVGASIGILSIGMPTGVMMLVGSFVMCGALGLRMMGKPYWVYAGVVTAAAVLMTGAGMDPLEALEDRLVFTLAGALGAVALGAGITWLIHLAHIHRDVRTEATASA